MVGGEGEQADAADEAHGGWKVSKVACLHFMSASQLIRGVRQLGEAWSVDDECAPRLTVPSLKGR